MLTIVWDVDDVLNDLMYQWFTHCWLEENPDCKHTYAKLTANPPHEVLGISREAYLESIDRFRTTERAMNMQPNRAVLEWLQTHGARFRHIALTTRPLETAQDVAHWVMRHFGSWVRCFGVVQTRPSKDVPAYDRSKGEYLRWIRCGDVIVDDSPENIAQGQSLGMKTLLYPQPWNNSPLNVDALLKEISDLAVLS